jgi:hypothetical protein
MAGGREPPSSAQPLAPGRTHPDNPKGPRIRYCEAALSAPARLRGEGALRAAEGYHTGVPGIGANPVPHAATRFDASNGVAVRRQTAS